MELNILSQIFNLTTLSNWRKKNYLIWTEYLIEGLVCIAIKSKNESDVFEKEFHEFLVLKIGLFSQIQATVTQIYEHNSEEFHRTGKM